MATSGEVLTLYMTLPDFMRSGNRTVVDGFECDHNGIVDDKNYEVEGSNMILLVSQKSYDIIDESEVSLDKGILLENIFVDIDINHLNKGSLIEIGDTIFEVTGPCRAYQYLYAFAPEIPELIEGNRGIFVTPVEYGRLEVGNKVTILKEI